MNEDYFVAVMLNVVSNDSEIIIRLDSCFETDDGQQNPVMELRLKGGELSQDNIQLLNDYAFSEVEIFFEEENNQKYLYLIFDYNEEGELRIAYENYERRDDAYSIGELRKKLKFVNQNYKRIDELYWKESKKHLDLIHKLEREFHKEIDRAERKKDFFAGSEKEEKFEIQRLCYQRTLDLLEQFIEEGRD